MREIRPVRPESTATSAGLSGFAAGLTGCALGGAGGIALAVLLWKGLRALAR